MKTAISLPDSLFEAAEELAARLSMSRSQLYSAALMAYLEAWRDEGITERLNRIYADESPDLDPMIAALQSASLTREEW